ncbi:MAG TPA: hypothetical protein VJY47_02605 [Candidatus Dojkabacteria bacterium]|nr:hypothetical protein [Candidatus Dojkabacteria bacterium]
MKIKVLILIAIILLGLFFVVVLGDKGGDHYLDSGKISFVKETNPRYIGSYRLERCSLNAPTICWDEWGEWYSAVELFFDTNKRICPESGQIAVFKSNEDFYWKRDGSCFQLEKK